MIKVTRKAIRAPLLTLLRMYSCTLITMLFCCSATELFLDTYMQAAAADSSLESQTATFRLCNYVGR